MAHAAAAGNGDDREIPVIDVSKQSADRGRPERGFERRPAGRREFPAAPREGAAGRLVDRPPQRHIDADGRVVRLFVGAGRIAGVRPGDLVGAITGEAGIDSRSLGSIEIGDRFSLVEVPEAMADQIITAMKSANIRGKKVQFRRERFE